MNSKNSPLFINVIFEGELQYDIEKAHKSID